MAKQTNNQSALKLALAMLGVIGALQQDNRAAVENWLLLKEIAPNTTIALQGKTDGLHFFLSSSLKRLNRSEEVRQVLEEGTILFPKSIGIPHKLGILHFERSEFNKALVYFWRAAQNAQFGTVKHLLAYTHYVHSALRHCRWYPMGNSTAEEGPDFDEYMPTLQRLIDAVALPTSTVPMQPPHFPEFNLTAAQCLSLAKLTATNILKGTDKYRERHSVSAATQAKWGANAANSSATSLHSFDIFLPFQKWWREFVPSKENKRGTNKPLRVGYVSGTGFTGVYPTPRLLLGVFENHSQRVTVVCIALRDERSDRMVQFLREHPKKYCDEFVFAFDSDDYAAAATIARAKVDILVDITGYTLLYRTGVLALRPSPIVVNFHGYPGTLGMPRSVVRYVVSDPITTPPGSTAAAGFAEEIVYMPNSYFAASHAVFAPLSEVESVIAQLTSATLHRSGIPKGTLLATALEAKLAGNPDRPIVFACWSSLYKIDPHVFARWMSILQRTSGDSGSGSVLWMLRFSDDAAKSLLAEAQRHGIDTTRVVFTSLFDSDVEHAVKSLADIYLDTPMFNGHTTVADVLWAGVPMVTMQGGDQMASRAAASMATAIRCPEMVVKTLQDYEDLAVRWATNPEELAAVTTKLRSNRLTTPLFDMKQWTRKWETKLFEMWGRFEQEQIDSQLTVIGE